VTNETLTTAYQSPVTHLFYIVSYETMRRREEENELKKYRRQGFGGM
jgi:hypothetical protein